MRTSVGPFVALVATVVLAVVAPAGGSGVAAASENEATCSTSGVTVYVDYGDLGDGVRAGCANDGGGERASAILPHAGFPLTYAARSTGFVCRVTGVPASDPCLDAPPATAYWSVWWNDGSSPDWIYSNRGVTSLRVPEGGALALKWHRGPQQATAPDVGPPLTGVADGSADAPDVQPPPSDGLADGADDGDGLPTWLPLTAIAALALAGVLLARRRRS